MAPSKAQDETELSLNGTKFPPSRPRVAIARCPSYEQANVRQALELIVENLGGLPGFSFRGRRVFVKINHLSPSSPPERAILTHPALAREVVHVLMESGATVTVGDDIYSPARDGFAKSGYREVCSELGVQLINLKEGGFVEVDIPGQVLSKAYVARPVLESDAIVNLPKLKTHSFTIFTGAVKNIYGVIPHGLRLNYHRQFVRMDVFSRMLVDLFSCVRPQLNIMDAVVAMEGEGPSAGSPREVGLLLASSDAVALDAVASRIIDLDPMAVYTTAIAHARGLGVGDIRQLEILGPALEEVAIRGFKHSAAAVSLFRRWFPSFLYAYLQEQLVLIPEVDRQKCTACQECVTMCPRQAIAIINQVAQINQADCIHCLCCHEVCYHKAIRLKKLPLGRLLRRGEILLKKIDRVSSFIRSSFRSSFRRPAARTSR